MMKIAEISITEAVWPETGQVKIPTEVLDQLLDRDMIPAPERYPVEFHPQSRRGKAGDQQFVAPQLPACANGQRILPRKPYTLPLDRSLRRRLHRYKKPLMG